MKITLKITLFKPLFLSLAFCLLVFNTNSFAQPVKDSGNLYTKWMKLALLGKNQAEIEYFFRNEKDSTLEQVKQRIRNAVVDNLRRAGIPALIAETSDADDFNVIIRKILIEIRYTGMELDPDLRLSIKEEFGVVLERL